MSRIKLRSIQPGQRLVAIEPTRLVGPRGGRYVFDGYRPSGGPVEFERSVLSPDGKTRTFHFAGIAPFVVSDRVSCLAVAQIEDAA